MASQARSRSRASRPITSGFSASRTKLRATRTFMGLDSPYPVMPWSVRTTTKSESQLSIQVSTSVIFIRVRERALARRTEDREAASVAGQARPRNPRLVVRDMSSQRFKISPQSSMGEAEYKTFQFGLPPPDPLRRGEIACRVPPNSEDLETRRRLQTGSAGKGAADGGDQAAFHHARKSRRSVCP